MIMRSGTAPQAMYFYHHAFPIDTYGQWQFVDVNMTISRVMGYPKQINMQEVLPAVGQMKKPWAKDLFTLAGSTRVFMRMQAAPEDRPVARLMHGKEVMSAMGWHRQWFKPGLPSGSKSNSHEFLCSMAGRSFSAFTFLPVALAALASIGLHAKDVVQDAENQGQDDEGDSSDSSAVIIGFDGDLS